jgi:DNA-binding IclR family transcriptional regulator
MTTPPAPPFLAEAAQTLAVLEAFTPVFPALGLQDVARRSGVPAEQVARIVFTLRERGYLQADGEGHYRLGANLIGITRNFLGARGVRALARGPMEALATRFRAPVALSERDGLEMLYLEYVRGEAAVVVQHRIGTRLPLASSAAGRAWLAAAPAAEGEVVSHQLAIRLHREWSGLQPKLEQARRDVEQLGFSRSYGDLQPEVNAVAVPLRSPIDGLVVVFSLAAPSMVASTKRFDTELGPALQAMVQALHAELQSIGAAPGTWVSRP